MPSSPITASPRPVAADAAPWEACLADFRAACRSDRPPAVAAIRDWLGRVPADDRPHALVDLAAEHLRAAWEAGRGTRLEEYVAALGAEFAEFASAADLPLDLIEHEFLARHEFPGRSDHPAPAEYARRFSDRPDVPARLRARCVAGGRYVKVRVAGEGGLGLVWVAYDRRLGRYVALKELQPEVAGDERVCRRLAAEARVTAGLEHPAIVAVHELRPGGAGPPFYVMRLVRGQTLRERIRAYHQAPPGDAGERGLRWDELLRAFVTVCDAVAYAHSRGVIHRDLKPHNVVLGEFGETVVLDWGLARCAGGPDREDEGDRGPEPTLSHAVGTLAYIAPEQLRGESDERSDVFSLGAILYEVLTGRPPYAEADGETTGAFRARIDEARHPKPRQVRPGVPRALEAVCLKAMAPDPAARYASARELGREVTRYLAGERVEAYAEPWPERAVRRLRRRKRQAAAFAAVVVVALAGVTGQWLRADHQRRLAEANAARASERGAEADRQHGLAQARLDLFAGAVEDYFDEAYKNPLLRGENMSAVRTALLEASLQHYRDVIRQHPADGGVTPGLGRAYFRVATIVDTVGTQAEAIEAYRAALPVLEQLVRAHPDDERFQFDLAGCYDALGTLHAELHQSEAALRAYQQSCPWRERHVRANPTVMRFKRDLATVYGNLAHQLRPLGRHEAARDFDSRASLLYEELLADKRARADPTDPRSQADLAACYQRLGGTQQRTGRWEAAVRSYQQACAVFAELCRGHPAVPGYRNDLATACTFLANAQNGLGQFDAALRSYGRARACYVELVAAYPDRLEYQSKLGNAWNYPGLVLIAQGRYEEALAGYREGIEHLRAVVARAPREPRYRKSLGDLYLYLACVQRLLGRPADAAATLRECLSHGPAKPSEPYGLGCALARCVTLMGAKSHHLTAAMKAELQAYADEAMGQLRRAVADGFADAAYLRADRDLDPLRARADFQQLLADLEKASAVKEKSAVNSPGGSPVP